MLRSLTITLKINLGEIMDHYIYGSEFNDDIADAIGIGYASAMIDKFNWE